MMAATHASDINISGNISTPQTFAATGDTLTIQNGGNLAVTNATAVTNSRSNVRIILDASGNNGISSTGNFSAIANNSGSIALLKINSGTISNSFESGATVAITGGSASAVATSDCTASTTCIINSGTISNSANSGFAISFGIENTTNRNLTITNNGTIKVSDNAASKAINIFSDTNGGSKYNLNNSGTIDAGNLGTAFYTSESASNNTTTISNSGIINGAIITASSANLSLINSGSINGNINLGSNSSSNISLNGGIISGNISINHTSQTLDFSGGRVNGNIDGVGQIFVNSQTNLGGNLSASAITLNSASSLNTDNFNLSSSSTITISAGAILNLGSGNISANIQSFGADNVGEVNFLENNILRGDLGNGTTRSLAIVGISERKELSVNGFNIDSQQINLAENSKLIFLTGSVKAASINLSQGSILTLGNIVPNAVIQGAGKIFFSENFTLSQNLANVSNPLSAIEVGSGKVFSSGNFEVYSNQIILNSQSEINLANASIKEAGSISGNAIFSSTNSNFDFISGNFKTNSTIRNTNNINVAAASTLILNHDVSANNFNLAGNLELGNSAHLISGNFSTAAGSALKLTILNQTTSGNIVASGTAALDSQTRLEVSLNNSFYIPSNTIFNIISASAISGSQLLVDVNNSNSNQIGSMIFSTQIIDNRLVLVLTRAANQNLMNDEKTKNIYQNLLQIKNGGAEILALQEFIDDENIDYATKSKTLQSLTPKANNSLTNIAFGNAKSSINTAIDRLQNFYAIAAGDAPEGFGIWGKFFGNNSKSAQNYNSKSSGFVFGFDHEVKNNLYVGLALSYARSGITSQVQMQDSSTNTYQINFYSSKNFEKFFINSILGFSQNQFSSQRKIDFQNLVANANYQGRSYIGKIEIGSSKNLKNGFVLTPLISSTYITNQVDAYEEKGAGSLNLKVKNQNDKFFEARSGILLGYNKTTSKGFRLNPNLKASYGHAFLNSRQSSTINFVGQDSSIRIQGQKQARNSAIFGFGLNIITSNALTFNAEYFIEQRRDFKSETISANLRYDF